MPKGKIHDKNTVIGQVEQIVELLFSGKKLPEKEVDRIRQWLVEGEHAELKSEALRQKFTQEYKYESNPKYAVEMWPELAKRLGFDPELNVIPKSKKVPLYKRVAFRVAAVVVPLLALGAGIFLMLDRQPADLIPATEMIALTAVEDSSRVVTLPDGSTVKIGAGAQLAYAADFEVNRQVTLNGEAYFTVTKDAQHPFTVESDGLLVTVLGTEFNVRAYESDTLQEVILTEGSVSVVAEDQICMLEPMQRLTIDKTTHMLAVDQLSEGFLMHLLGEELRFDGITLGRAFKLLGEYFGVEVVVEGEIDLSEPAYMTFPADETLNNVLSIIQLTYPKFGYTIDANIVTIQSK